MVKLEEEPLFLWQKCVRLRVTNPYIASVTLIGPFLYTVDRLSMTNLAHDQDGHEEIASIIEIALLLSECGLAHRIITSINLVTRVDFLKL